MAYIIEIVLGLAILIGGGELLVRGAVQLARAYNIPGTIIGLTIVSFGTSAPELVVSLDAALSGSPGIALGNVIGSNIMNILLILGISALFMPVVATQLILRRDGVIMALLGAIFFWMCQDLLLSRIEGLILFSGVIAYSLYVYKTAAFHHTEELVGEVVELPSKPVCTWCAAAYAFIGLALLAVGADILVGGASSFAYTLGVSEAVIGITIVALGTSAPELTTSLMAALRGHNDVSVANIIGSCIYNTAGIAGLTALVHPIAVEPSLATFDAGIMLAVMIGAIWLMLVRGRLRVLEGTVFLALLTCYLLYQYRTIA